MAIRLIVGVWKLKLTSTQKLVLLSLADHADRYGESYPSVNRIAWETSLSYRTVQIALRELTKAQIIIPFRDVYGGRGTPTRYYIGLEGSEMQPPFQRGERGGHARSIEGDEF